ncbi:hypothetical protein CCH79_00013409 [Gambusia affinis]|uniref:Uncharacterized protein n=1 Tax=Gambusia affinis TaxID=33528 RepID=A0A315W7R1_GAMAF|nr:hypothetical protein CCH79_00013409 [Gambusia affinis]
MAYSPEITTDSKVNGTALSSPSTSSQRSDSSLPLLRVAASQTTDTMGKEPSVEQETVGDDEFSSPSQDASGLEEVVEQLNNTFPHSQTKLSWLPKNDKVFKKCYSFNRVAIELNWNDF